MVDDFKKTALDYHTQPKAGKISIQPTKPLSTQRDLALAYSPGVAFACEEIVRDPFTVSDLTIQSNLVGVVTNGTAVLGLGDIGPLAAKPVMEGKAVLFKNFAGIDVFDIEINEKDPKKLIEIIASLEPTFGAINLEDIKAPECFEVERDLQARMKIPVFHDDQHGTAITVSAALTNALKLVKKDLSKIKLVTSGAGAAALACLDLLVSMGLSKRNIYVTDLKGVVYEGRTELMDPRKAGYAQNTKARILADVIEGADVFLGLSAPHVLKPEMVAKMAKQPIIMALANPTPEIMPDEVYAVRPDAIMATGRSDFPNQVNNVLCFPFIFRGALDVGATCINHDMRIACVKALADLAMAEASDVVAHAYEGQNLKFGKDYLIPKPFDPRLIVKIAPAVAKAAMDSGVATRPITDFEAYHEKLMQFVFRSGTLMQPIFMRAKQAPKRVVYAEGEDERVLSAVQILVDDKIAYPILIARKSVLQKRIEKLGLRLQEGIDYDVVDPENDPRYTEYWTLYHKLMQRSGITPDSARMIVRTNTTVIGALMVLRAEADAMIAGTIGLYQRHLHYVIELIGCKKGVKKPAAMNALVLPTGTVFICDTYVSMNPEAEEIAETTLLAAAEIQKFGIPPKIALLSYSSFGSHKDPSAVKMRRVREILMERAPDLEVEGEMHADAAIIENIREKIFPNSTLKGQANLLILPNLDAANISFNLLKVLGNGLSIGPFLMGANKPVHIVTPSVTVRGLVNMSALAVIDAQSQEG